MAKLTITRCSTDSGQITEMSGDENIFEATINPSSYKHSFATRYSGTGDDQDSAVGKMKPIPKYSAPEPQKIGFSITLDGTGVVPATRDTTVAEQIEKLRKVAYEYDGDTHEPNPVRIDWGEGIAEFFGRLTSLDVDYSLFDPEGAPLRAEISLDFIEAITEEEEAREADNQSPDLTHLVMVEAGDTLPLLCQRIYKDGGKYLEIARLNDLSDFRALQPGTLLSFPPMR